MKEKLKRLACDPRALLWLWVLIAVSGMTRLGHGRENNFLIFKYVYWHVVGQQPLYEHYPAEYFDMNHYGPFFSLVMNHYGPFFSLVIAPFALPPVWLGMLLWLVALTLALYVAVRHNFFTRWQQVVIFWFCSHELLNAIQMQQFNIAIAAIIVGSSAITSSVRSATSGQLSSSCLAHSSSSTASWGSPSSSSRATKGDSSPRVPSGQR